MALGEGVKCSVVDGEIEEMLGFGCVKYKRGLGWKKIVIFSNIWILCGVEPEDLKQLVQVSKSIKNVVSLSNPVPSSLH
ncbi:uncharacterized protein LOC116188749 [Punica granatum]|uniref:Uncharacterized protein LOC116188749 n=1 Tax=Punica granatum TaxID=22663 RepID=A0A6P8BUW6_PUNGR|nr:uncharacterized protein LOC116188749 [Punica granatum]